ncbi:cysteine hydrolase family protein [Sciscionella sediminilitoris]|uniref:cysteine hydrolase family protein n=1 Tax=Sciscionella sediminilitoris TaxID=1445613 RepID=UPI00055CF27B|nr:isochorismatase family cysteine hydrolase [Sciscionella sp. SE31]
MPSKPPDLVPHRTALLLMDLQPAILDGIPGSRRLLEQARRAQQAALKAGIQEIQVRVAFTPEEHAAVPDHNKTFAPLAKAGRLAEDTPETAIHPLLRTEGSACTVTKTRVSAFSTTGLDSLLREKGIDTLVLGGTITSGVVLSTIRDAADRDYRLLLLEDACADSDPHRHDILMRSILPIHADLLAVADFESAAHMASAPYRQDR